MKDEREKARKEAKAVRLAKPNKKQKWEMTSHQPGQLFESELFSPPVRGGHCEFFSEVFFSTNTNSFSAIGHNPEPPLQPTDGNRQNAIGNENFLCE